MVSTPSSSSTRSGRTSSIEYASLTPLVLSKMYVTVDLETFRAQAEPYRQQRIPEERRMEAVARRVAERNF
jgi:hypothetical protein